jgi:hypothetical protein
MEFHSNLLQFQCNVEGVRNIWGRHTVILTTVCSLRWWQTSIITERAEKRAPSLEKILKCLEEKTRDSVIDAVRNRDPEGCDNWSVSCFVKDSARRDCRALSIRNTGTSISDQSTHEATANTTSGNSTSTVTPNISPLQN